MFSGWERVRQREWGPLLRGGKGTVCDKVHTRSVLEQRPEWRQNLQAEEQKSTEEDRDTEKCTGGSMHCAVTYSAEKNQMLPQTLTG